MKFTLKDYQDKAVREVLENLKKTRKRWHEDKERNAFSLSAVTGAGKTVMAAAVFEALFHGSEEFNFERDPGAIVIWFSDSPALNEQTRFRFMEVSDRINPYTDLKVVEADNFNRSKFEAGKIYFLNTQKFGQNSLLVRGFDQEVDARQGVLLDTRPDLRAFTLWDVIKNTIDDPSLTLYFVLDEAHRGMGRATGAAERATIVTRLINGEKGIPGLPVVWGISATVQRFEEAMRVAQKRTRLDPVVVDSALVQESGLLKDTIILDIPEGAGDFDTLLVRRGTDQLKQSTLAWAEYAKAQDDSPRVTPLMVLQVPNNPNANDIAKALDTIFERWPDLPRDCVANVFGEHRTEQFGGFSVPYISPEQVQDHAWIRILIAKDAISTGWDCPRAEVMVSFRPATDQTHITQLLGRMVRTPLARRIPSNDMLNSVYCLLPHFDKDTAKAVVNMLMTGDDDTKPKFGRVLINPSTMGPNPNVSEPVWEKFVSLPSQTRPQQSAKPAKRLTALAQELITDNFLPGAGKKAHDLMHKVLDDAREKFKDKIEARRTAVLEIEGVTVKGNIKDQVMSLDGFSEAADMAVIHDMFQRAARVFSLPIAKSYAHYLAMQLAEPDDQDDLEEKLMEAEVEIAALGLVGEVQPFYDAAADQHAKAWFAEYKPRIKQLSDDREEAYREILEMSADPQDVDMLKPSAKAEMTAVHENGQDTPIPTYPLHLLCDGQGNYPAQLNAWEVAVLKQESQRAGFQFWYRNPQQPGPSSLGIAYQDHDQYLILRPDFIFFADEGGKVVADLIDPHGIHLSDALPKLRGLAAYAAAHHPGAFRRIESVAEVKGKLRMLDLTRAEVRDAIFAATLTATGLFEGPLASDYLD
ncbi:Type III restriction enzyme, res subunit [Caballeronia fortuita]|uniref:Type III restriction enzyme, res subunit n=1 Tax=Caballeronia fortuita TaxID=1777138 RepID=A0A157Z607_9BURK|nr:DEAD/DEAH box helicase family protein [Caballeronia fortuita]SAK40945.1 Type III restriction enzyme, res subunit [Caballeronia fortuita]